MRKNIVFYALILFIGLINPALTQSNSEKKTYTGIMKNVHFDYSKQWILDDGNTALTLTPDEFGNFIEIHRDSLALSETAMLNQIMDEGSIYKPVTFNGMKAYQFEADSFFIFSNNILYSFSTNRKGTAFSADLETIKNSFRIVN